MLLIMNFKKLWSLPLGVAAVVLSYPPVVVAFKETLPTKM